MKLSDKEWRVLNALWVAPEGLALGAVVDALRPDTGWSRSTVLTYGNQRYTCTAYPAEVTP